MKFWIDGTWTKMLQNSHHKENCFDLGIYKQGRYHSFSACFFSFCLPPTQVETRILLASKVGVL